MYKIINQELIQFLPLCWDLYHCHHHLCWLLQKHQLYDNVADVVVEKMNDDDIVVAVGDVAADYDNAAVVFLRCCADYESVVDVVAAADAVVDIDVANYCDEAYDVTAVVVVLEAVDEDDSGYCDVVLKVMGCGGGEGISGGVMKVFPIIKSDSTSSIRQVWFLLLLWEWVYFVVAMYQCFDIVVAAAVVVFLVSFEAGSDDVAAVLVVVAVFDNANAAVAVEAADVVAVVYLQLLYVDYNVVVLKL
ncbi:hypothetical protein FF38_11982 [Lucilia cuprina]|uniref:Uncharacterized protein n=1 Tax=Lucilia cuprina TaxID=7375 RepID=A0A0L0CGH8_LUCCU|nr:hypothetical protein FF38_11982 [Lucilia cuprina]